LSRTADQEGPAPFQVRPCGYARTQGSWRRPAGGIASASHETRRMWVFSGLLAGACVKRLWGVHVIRAYPNKRSSIHKLARRLGRAHALDTSRAFLGGPVANARRRTSWPVHQQAFGPIDKLRSTSSFSLGRRWRSCTSRANARERLEDRRTPRCLQAFDQISAHAH